MARQWGAPAPRAKPERRVRNEKEREEKNPFPLHVALGGSCPSGSPAFESPGWGRGACLTCRALAGQQHPKAQQDAQPGHRSRSLRRGTRGAPGPAARGSPVRMLRPSPGDRLWGVRSAPAPGPPDWRKTTGAGPLPPLRRLPPPWPGGGPCAMIPVPRGPGGGGPEVRPAGAGRAPGLCTGPARRLYRACHLGSRCRGGPRRRRRSESGKDDPSTARPRATTGLGFSNELGSRPHGRSRVFFSGAPTPIPLAVPTPTPADPGNATFPGSQWTRSLQCPASICP